MKVTPTVVLDAALFREVREVLRNLAEFWDAGSPVHPGSDVSADARAILRELEKIG